MSTIKPLAAALLTALFFTACSERTDLSQEEKAISSYVAMADSVSHNPADLNSDMRKVIRTADIKCRVDDVPHTVNNIETFVSHTGGFVEKSHSGTEIIAQKTVGHFKDSVKTAQVYRTTADMTIRVPAMKLDTLAGYISNIASFVHYRNLERQDVTLQFLSNALKNKEADKTATASEAMSPVKSKDAIDVLNYHDRNTNVQVDRRVANLAILDNTQYATITLSLYQPDQVMLYVTQDVDKVVTAGYGEQLLLAFTRSWEIVKSFILAIITLWPIWLGVVVIVYVYRRMGRRSKLKTTLPRA